MNSQDLQQLLKVMEEIVDLEITLADLYHACSKAFSEDTHFWYAIKRQEEHHADSIRKMSALVAANPQEFAPGGNFNAAAIRAIKKSALAHLAAVKRGEIAQARMAALARDIESSVLDVNYRGLVKTANVKFLDAMKRVDDETMAHKNLMVKKIAALKS